MKTATGFCTDILNMRKRFLAHLLLCSRTFHRNFWSRRQCRSSGSHCTDSGHGSAIIQLNNAVWQPWRLKGLGNWQSSVVAVFPANTLGHNTLHRFYGR